jgi:hypothetical protein
MRLIGMCFVMPVIKAAFVIYLTHNSSILVNSLPNERPLFYWISQIILILPALFKSENDGFSKLMIDGWNYYKCKFSFIHENSIRAVIF